ncbi:MAG: hypothetical protein GEV07_30265 [Streptosporangiales bacterium]|nr:hypothetical protein [Streptosporangiales bacterium]
MNAPHPQHTHHARPSRRSRRLAALGAGLALLTTACTTQSPSNDQAEQAADDYPNRSISWIVPYAPGGGSDRQVRRLQPHMEKSLGKKINVVYKEGGDGAVGWQELANATADGYTIANVVAPNVMQLEIDGDTGYESKEFEYVSWTETAPNVLVVAKNSKYKTIDDFVAAAKKNPGKLTVAGTGKTGKLSWAEMSEALGVRASYVPVSAGVGDIVPDLKGGHIDAAVFGASHAVEYEDNMHPLAITGTESVAALPDAPTLESEGYGSAVLGTSWGVIAPPGTPKPIVDKLNKAVNDAMAKEKVQTALDEGGLTALSHTPKQATKYADDQRKQLVTVNDEVSK